MGYQTAQFLAFSAMMLFFYYLLGKKLQKWVLLLANIIFYAVAGTEYLPFLVGVMLVSYLAGLWMRSIYKETDASLAQCETPEEKKQERAKGKKKAKAVMLVALILMVGLLVVCKYTKFILQNVNKILTYFGAEKFELFNIVMPLGISYYTFMAISYVLDVYWKRYEAESNFVIYGAYLSFFPHIVQGPIDRFNKFKPQLEGGVELSCKNLSFGAQLVIWGLFKKLVVADRIAPFVNEIYGNFNEYTGVIFVLATVLYSMQLYADFSGCVDIATGISQMFGISIAKNFNHPFFAKTIPEFWRRWHISLMEWFKDYMYYPISTSSFFKKVRRFFKERDAKRCELIFTGCFPALVIWFVTGIWHGASWKYVAWGMYNALLVILGIVFGDFNKGLTEKLGIQEERFSWRLWQMLRTFALCCAGRVFARAGSFMSAIGIWKNMFAGWGLGFVLDHNIYSYGINKNDFIIVGVSLLLMWAVDMLQERISIRETLAKQGTIFRWALIYAAILTILLFGIYGPGYDASAFIYGKY